MPSKIDRALGAFIIAFAAFFLVASRTSSEAGVLATTAGTITLWIALLAAVPGIWLLVKGRSI